MKKTPLWGNALRILNVHQEHDTLNYNQSTRKGASDDVCK